MPQPAPRARSPSHMYHDSWRELCTSQISAVYDPKRLRLQQSRRLPPWLWFLLSHSLGISQRYRRHMWVGLVLHLFTVSTSLAYASSSVLHLVYDVKSTSTKSTIFTGLADVVLGACWVSVGVYANRLAFRIFTSPPLADNVRLHTRTLFRVNLALVVLLLGVAGFGLHLYFRLDLLAGSSCRHVGLSPLVCQIRYGTGTAYGLMLLYWNIIVAWAALSICRTHTISCRRFTREMEFEGKVVEKLYRIRQASRLRRVCPPAAFNYGHHEAANDGWVTPGLTDEDPDAVLRPSDFMSTVTELEEEEAEANAAARMVLLGLPAGGRRVESHHLEEIPESPPDRASINTESTGRPPVGSPREMRHPGPATTVPDSSPSPPPSLASSTTASAAANHHVRHNDLRRNLPLLFRQLETEGVHDGAPYEELLLTGDDVCVRMSQISSRLRITSLVFQRWFGTWLVFAGLWVLDYVIHWLNHPATLLQLCHFFIPVLLMGMLATSYAEVNLETDRSVRAVPARQDRLMVNRLLIMDPPYLTVFGMAMTYQVVGGSVVALFVTFATKLIMDAFH